MVNFRLWLIPVLAISIISSCGGDADRHENASSGNAMANAMVGDPFSQSELAMMDAAEAAV